MPFNKLEHTYVGLLRPRFRLRTSLDPDKALEKVRLAMSQDQTVTGQVRMSYAFIKIPPPVAHYWSPELQVRIESDEFTNETIAACQLGPKQTVWAMFSLFYAVIILLSIFGGIWGFTQYQLGHQTVWLYFPLGLLLVPTIFFLARAGQRKGRDEMLHLVSFLYHTLEEHGEVERMH